MAEATAGSDRRPLTNWNYVSYAAPAAPLALSGLPIAVYLPAIYGDSEGFGLSLAVVGTLLALSRISDVVTDPLIGYLSDKWKTRWGRRKPWVLVGTPIFGVGMWYLFMPPFEFALLMLACTYSVIPAIFKFVGMPLLWIYPLTDEKLAEVQADINKRHGIAGS